MSFGIYIVGSEGHAVLTCATGHRRDRRRVTSTVVLPNGSPVIAT